MTKEEELIQYAKTSLKRASEVIDTLKLDNIKIKDMIIEPYFCYGSYSFIINYTILILKDQTEIKKQVRSNMTTKKEQFYRIDALMYELISRVCYNDILSVY